MDVTQTSDARFSLTGSRRNGSEDLHAKPVLASGMALSSSAPSSSSPLARLLRRAASHRAMHWKNGGGMTYEIASFPVTGTTLEHFAWRISMAEVASDGPFSTFPGIDRSLAVITGAGLQLAIDGQPEIAVTSATEPVAFAADVATASRLIAGAVTDCNVMTRRGLWRHRLQRFTLTGERAFRRTADVTMLLVCDKMLEVSSGGGRLTANARDALVLDATTDAAQIITLKGDDTTVLRADLWRAES
jgi:environmental stress-induced protein Ves